MSFPREWEGEGTASDNSNEVSLWATGCRGDAKDIFI